MDKSSSWKISAAGIISTLLMIALDVTPILALLLITPFAAAAGVAGFCALSFWFPTYKVIKLSLEHKELPTISGGPQVRSYQRRDH